MFKIPITPQEYTRSHLHLIKLDYHEQKGIQSIPQATIFLSNLQELESESVKEYLNKNQRVKSVQLCFEAGIKSIETKQRQQEIDHILQVRIFQCIKVFNELKDAFTELDSIEIMNFSSHNNLILPIFEWIHSLSSLKALKIRSIIPFTIDLFNSYQKAVFSQSSTIQTLILHFTLTQQLPQETNKSESYLIKSIKSLSILGDQQQFIFSYLDNFNEIQELEIFIIDKTTNEILNEIKKNEKKWIKLSLNYDNTTNNLISNEDFFHLQKFRYLSSLEIKYNLPLKKSSELFDLPPYLTSLSLSLKNPVEFLNSSTKKILPSLTSLEISSYLSTKHAPINFEFYPNLTSLSLSYNPSTQGKIQQIIQTDFINLRPIANQLESLSFNLDFDPLKSDYFQQEKISCINDILSRTNNTCKIKIELKIFQLSSVSIFQMVSSLVHLTNVENQLTINSLALKDSQEYLKNEKLIRVSNHDHSLFLCLLAKSSKWFQQKVIQLNLCNILKSLNELRKLNVNVKSIFEGITNFDIFIYRNYNNKNKNEFDQDIYQNLKFLIDQDQPRSIAISGLLPYNFLKECVKGWKNLQKIQLLNMNSILQDNQFLDQLEQFRADSITLSTPKICLDLFVNHECNSFNEVVSPFLSLQNNFLQIICEKVNLSLEQYLNAFQQILNSNFRFTGQFSLFFTQTYKQQQVIRAINSYSNEIEIQLLIAIAFESNLKSLLPIHPASVLTDLYFD